MYLQFHSVKESSKNHDIWVRVLFGSLRSRVRLCSWQNLGSGSVRCCWVRFFPISSSQRERAQTEETVAGRGNANAGVQQSIRRRPWATLSVPPARRDMNYEHACIALLVLYPDRPDHIITHLHLPTTTPVVVAQPSRSYNTHTPMQDLGYYFKYYVGLIFSHHYNETGLEIKERMSVTSFSYRFNWITKTVDLWQCQCQCKMWQQANLRTHFSLLS